MLDPISQRKVLVLVGPTGSGKTEVSIHLARRLNGEIISADSRQIYTHLDIGTAKPSEVLRAEIRHYFVDELSPERVFNAGEFGIRGRRVIHDIFKRCLTPIVVGGSGLYIQSLIDGFFEGPGADWEFRELLERRVAEGQIGDLIEELRRVDPVSAEKADRTKPRRIVRALEVYHSTGRSLSDHHRVQKVEVDFTPTLFGLEWDRGELYRRIERRCEEMIAAGLLDEVDVLERLGFTSTMNALNTVGYREAFSYREGRVSFQEMMRLFKQNSRRYAKRQLTWFRRDKRIRWIRMDERKRSQEAAEQIAETFRRS